MRFFYLYYIRLMLKSLKLLVVYCTMLQLLPAQDRISTIAFGSCSNQDKDQSILYKVIDKHPDLFIYLGDNIYGDTKDMNVMKAKYAKLAAKPEFQALVRSCKVLATWDDHDYGKNDSGRKYAKKEESKEVFLEFWKEAEGSTRFDHKGIYHAEYFGSGDEMVQVILLDTRTFRTRLKYSFIRFAKYKNDYRPNYSKAANFLGEEQWDFLKKELEKPAALRIIASSTQFAHEYNGYESWNNFPLEKERMLNLIKETKANGILFISGDVHWGELSAIENTGAYTIYDITSSGLTQTWGHTEDNSFRIGEVVPENNFGLIEIDWKNRMLLLQIIDREGIQRVVQKVPLKSLMN